MMVSEILLTHITLFFTSTFKHFGIFHSSIINPTPTETLKIRINGILFMIADCCAGAYGVAR